MKKVPSKAIRDQGDRIAFDHGQWEFQSRQFAYSANFLLSKHVAMMDRKEYEGILLLPTSQFLASLAIELIAKAYFLKLATADPTKIYSHEISTFCDGILLSKEEAKLLKLAESNVRWAGRYPTPQWTKEKFKTDYDVPSYTKDGIHFAEVNEMKNASSPNRVQDLLDLYSKIHEHWQGLS